MIGRLLTRQLKNGSKMLRPLNSKREFATAHKYKWWDPDPVYHYRNEPHEQDKIDWFLCFTLMAGLVSSTLINIYMFADELKLEEIEGFHLEESQFNNEELGIPSDELGYAPLKPEILEKGSIIDLGDFMRSESHHRYYYQVIRRADPNPFDV